MIESVILNGLTLTEQVGPNDYMIDTLQGWGAPGTTLQVEQRPRSNGGWAGDSFSQARTIVLAGEAYFESATDGRGMADALKVAAARTETLLAVTEDGLTRYATVRRDGEVIITWPSTSAHTFKWSVQLVAPDPRITGTDLSAITGLPSTTGGLTIPFTVPFTIASTVVSGQAFLTNPGNTNGRVRLRIDGPVTAPEVTHVASGRTLRFASSVVLGAGEFLTVDMERREVLANGQSSRNGWVTGRGWSQFEPGVNIWAFTAAVYNAGSLLTVTATPSWE